MSLINFQQWQKTQSNISTCQLFTIYLSSDRGGSSPYLSCPCEKLSITAFNRNENHIGDSFIFKCSTLKLYSVWHFLFFRSAAGFCVNLICKHYTSGKVIEWKEMWCTWISLKYSFGALFLSWDLLLLEKVSIDSDICRQPYQQQTANTRILQSLQMYKNHSLSQLLEISFTRNTCITIR